MYKKPIINYINNPTLLFMYLLSKKKKKDLDILPVNWSGKIITFVDLDLNYKNLEILTENGLKCTASIYHIINF